MSEFLRAQPTSPNCGRSLKASAFTPVSMSVHRSINRCTIRLLQSRTYRSPPQGCRVYAADPARSHRTHPVRLNNFVAKMSSATGDNLDTGGKAADPYTTKAKEDVPLKDKVQELGKFMEDCKFGMMTTRVKDSGLLTSRAMALASTVRLPFLLSSLTSLMSARSPTALTSSSTPILPQARPTRLLKTQPVRLLSCHKRLSPSRCLSLGETKRNPAP